MTEVIIVRPPVPADAAALGLVHTAAWRTAHRGLVPRSEYEQRTVSSSTQWWRERLGQGLHDTDARLITVDAVVRGYVMWGPARDEGEPGTELHAIYVQPSAWRSGFGSLLMEYVPTETYLWVLAGNTRAMRFYENRGFRFDGGRRRQFGTEALRYRRP